jgi:hypothetical protein
MQPIPDDILKQFDGVLEQKAVPSSLRDDYGNGFVITSISG